MRTLCDTAIAAAAAERRVADEMMAERARLEEHVARLLAVVEAQRRVITARFSRVPMLLLPPTFPQDREATGGRDAVEEDAAEAEEDEEEKQLDEEVDQLVSDLMSRRRAGSEARADRVSAHER